MINSGILPTEKLCRRIADLDISEALLTNGELVAAAGDLVRYNVMGGVKLGTFDAPADEFPVPLRVDNEGNIYTSDYENGGGTVSADIFKFSPEGLLLVNENDAGLLGPFGLAISGTVLAGDPPVAWSYVLAASDPDGDPLTYKLVSGPPDMFLDPATGAAGTAMSRSRTTPMCSTWSTSSVRRGPTAHATAWRRPHQPARSCCNVPANAARTWARRHR